MIKNRFHFSPLPAVNTTKPGPYSQPARWGGGGLNLGRWNTGARIQDFLKGGGGEDIHKHPPPLDIVRVTSSALQKIEKHPHSWTFTSIHPLDIARVTSSTFQGV